jgi:ATP-dependent Clp protease ATP-binding subunit ClpA
MFELYTEKARRVIFFARYESSQYGTPQIESEHLLLGLIREDRLILKRCAEHLFNEEEIRAAIDKMTPAGKRTSTSVDLPVSNECKRILAFAAEESVRAGADFVDTEHLLLGILREENCCAARLLCDRGFQLESVRATVASLSQREKGGEKKRGMPGSSVSLLGSTVYLVDASSSEAILSYQTLSSTPKIGEKIDVYEEGERIQSYRVQDVIWEIARNANVSSEHKIRVLLKQENSV